MDFTKLLTRVNYTMGQLVTALDWNRMGEVAARNLFNMFGWAHGARKTGNNTSLLVTGTGKSLDFLVTQVSGLDIEVAPGLAMVYDSGSIGSGDEFLPESYQAIVLDATYSTTLSTPGSYPRVDVVYAETDSNTDTTDGRFIKSASIASTPINTRKLWDALISVQDGTDGSYAVPSVGGTYIELARILHTSAGNITIYDTRPVLETSEALKAPPMGALTGDYCLHDEAAGTASDSLTLTATITPSLTVLLRPGIVVQNGRSWRVPFQPLTVSTPDGTHPRYDLVSFNNGTVTVTAGTPSASPAIPSTPVGAVPLSVYLVPAGATAISSFTSLREVNRWLTGAEFQSTAVLDSVSVGTLPWAVSTTHTKRFGVFDLIPDPATVDPGDYNAGATTYVTPDGASAQSSWFVPLGQALPEGCILASVTLYYSRETVSLGNISMSVVANESDGTSFYSSTASDSGGAAGSDTLVVSPRVTTNKFWGVALQATNADIKGMRIYGVEIVYTSTSVKTAVGGA